MTLGIRQRRAERQRRWRVIRGFLVVCAIVGLGAISYQTGAEIAHSRISGLESEIEQLTGRERNLGERNAQLEVELAEARRELTDWQVRYDADVPNGNARALMQKTNALLERGISPERIGLMIAAAGQELKCTGEPATRRFLVRTPIYRGANDAVTFADHAITVTATGESTNNAEGKPEAWFDPRQPVTIQFVALGGTPNQVSGTLPLHHSMLWNGAEYRFSVVEAEQRGFIRVSADRCDLPVK